jgi:hypothetical protein
MAAYAVHVTPENRHAIASEHPRFDLAEFNQWLLEHGENGYFIRDDRSAAFDCQYMDVEVFQTIYMFERGGTADLFRRIVRL